MEDSSDVTFFLGAGASAPFGIPTMKKLVLDFEQFLKDDGTEEEKATFGDIKNTLERTLKRQADLEDIFTVIDGIKNYGFDRIGLVSIYSSIKEFSTMPSPKVDNNICSTLEEKFEDFVRRKCLIPEDSYVNISAVYQDFFNNIWGSTSRSSSNIHRARGNFRFCTTWTIFTTNYDTCLEYYWRERARVHLNTGFRYDPARHTHVLDSRLFHQRPGDVLDLVKLHGSLSWMIEPDGTVTEQEALQARSFIGRRYVGPMMIYPIQQKELYLEPFITMFFQLNKELKEKSNWVVIGYSFNDPIIREIFLRNSDETKEIVFLHPHASDVASKHLQDLKCKDLHLLEKKFGMRQNYFQINQDIINCFE